MNVPAPPAPQVVGFGPIGIAADAALDATTPRGASINPTASTATTRLTVRRRTLDVLEWHPVVIAGTLSARHTVAGLAGRLVILQAFGHSGWRAVAIARTRTDGAFRLRLTPRRIGTERLRVRFAGEQYLLGTIRELGRLNVYRAVEASWYGGGGALACGGSLTSATMGVASRTLPCGTLVTLRWNGRSVRVPVVDRGPFVAGREFDLTEATKQALGFGDTGSLWSTS